MLEMGEIHRRIRKERNVGREKGKRERRDEGRERRKEEGRNKTIMLNASMFGRLSERAKVKGDENNKDLRPGDVKSESKVLASYGGQFGHP